MTAMKTTDTMNSKKKLAAPRNYLVKGNRAVASGDVSPVYCQCHYFQNEKKSFSVMVLSDQIVSIPLSKASWVGKSIEELIDYMKEKKYSHERVF